MMSDPIAVAIGGLAVIAVVVAVIVPLARHHRQPHDLPAHDPYEPAQRLAAGKPTIRRTLSDFRDSHHHPEARP